MKEIIHIEKKRFRIQLPEFLKQKVPSGAIFSHVTGSLQKFKLNTVCEEAKCPNRTHCYARGTLAFQILGDICTRSCGFCSEKFGDPKGVIDREEPRRVVEAAKKLDLKHVVITSPNRDDLEDDGSGQFADVIHLFRKELPRVTVEVLIPDFRGKAEPLKTVFKADPDIFNHNIETVRRLTPKVRSKATYDQSLGVLRSAANWAHRTAGATLPLLGQINPGAQESQKTLVKSGLMVGHGETQEELIETFRDLAEVGVQMFTIGQYLPPSPQHLPLIKVYLPVEFEKLKTAALKFGFIDVSAGPLVRSSYLADISVSKLKSKGVLST